MVLTTRYILITLKIHIAQLIKSKQCKQKYCERLLTKLLLALLLLSCVYVTSHMICLYAFNEYIVTIHVLESGYESISHKCL